MNACPEGELFWESSVHFLVLLVPVNRQEVCRQPCLMPAIRGVDIPIIGIGYENEFD